MEKEEAIGEYLEGNLSYSELEETVGEEVAEAVEVSTDIINSRYCERHSSLNQSPQSKADKKYETLGKRVEQMDSPELKTVYDRLREVDWFSSFREQLWHAKREGYRETVIILLNMFFEAYMNSELRKYYTERGLSESELFFLEGMRYSQILNRSRELDLISDNDYRILKELNKARNKYAHNLDYWAPAHKAEIEKQDEVEEAFKLQNDVLLNGPEILKED